MKTKNVNFRLEQSLIDRLKVLAIYASVERQQSVLWTQLIREMIAEKFPTAVGIKTNAEASHGTV